MDDLPNYQPVLNTYNKLEVRRFLKCVDSRPRKNFVNVKESVSCLCFLLYHLQTMLF